MVSFTHGEGFGRPLLEASAVGLPVIASNWSGQVDFLDTNYEVYENGNSIEIEHDDSPGAGQATWTIVCDAS